MQFAATWVEVEDIVVIVVSHKEEIDMEVQNDHSCGTQVTQRGSSNGPKAA